MCISSSNDCGEEYPYLRRLERDGSLSKLSETSKEKQIDEFLNLCGVKLLPFQREIFNQTINNNKIYICYPPNNGRTYFRMLSYMMAELLKGENND